MLLIMRQVCGCVRCEGRLLSDSYGVRDAPSPPPPAVPAQRQHDTVINNARVRRKHLIIGTFDLWKMHTKTRKMKIGRRARPTIAQTKMMGGLLFWMTAASLLVPLVDSVRPRLLRIPSTTTKRQEVMSHHSLPTSSGDSNAALLRKENERIL